MSNLEEAPEGGDQKGGPAVEENKVDLPVAIDQPPRQQIRGINGVRVTNWSETFECQPELYFVPKDTDELRDILLLAKSNSKHVRVIGRGHSPSDLPFTSDYLVSLARFDQILSVNETNHQVKVEAGITLTALNAQLDRLGLAMSILGSVSDLTLAGVISTATHGTGIRHTNIAGYVVELELLTSSGDLVRCSEEERTEVFKAALCGLGAVGVIITATLQCEKAFDLEQIQFPAEFEEVLDELDNHLSLSDHFRFLWFPHTNMVSISHVRRVESGFTTKLTVRERIVRWLWNYGVGYYALELSYWISSFMPRLVPLINQTAFTLLYSSPQTIIDRSDRIFNFECLFKQHVNEWCIPLEKTQVVLLELRRFIESTANLYVHFPVEVRFVKADDIYLSPASGRDSCYINIIMYRPYGREIPYQRYWDEYERIMREAGGRPHWAKAHRETAVDFVKMYPYFRAWCQVRKRMDPLNMFMNDYMRRIMATFPKD